MKSRIFKIISVILAVILVIGGILLVQNVINQKKNMSGSDKYSDYIFYRGDYNPKLKDNKYSGALANTYSKLTNDKKLKVV